MARRQIAFLTTTLLVLCAGVVVGRLTTKMPVLAVQGGERGQGPSWIAQQLNLSTQQRTQMDAIWADIRQKMDQAGEKRHELDRKRDADVQALLTDAQKAAYVKINDDYRAQRGAMDKERGMLISDAEKRSRDLLDENQQKKWDELTKDMHGRRGPHHGGIPGGGNPGGGPGGEHGGNSPDSQPATQPEQN
jgi:Spy/CpxP family protein refolding chaperone